jgi:hypothetical protein
MCYIALKLSMLSNTKWNISGLKVNWTLHNTKLTFLLSANFLVALVAQPFFTTHKKTTHPKKQRTVHISRKQIQRGIPYLFSKGM